MAVESSLNSWNEQLQIQVLVHNINLSSHKIRNVETSSLCVRAEFIDPTSFEIRQEEFVSLKKAEDESHHEKNCIDYRAGKTHLFVQLPSNVSKNMNKKPLKVEVISKNGSEFIQLCETSIFFSDCECKEKPSIVADKITVPIIPKNIYNLVDSQGEASGTIELSLNLCSRKSIAFENKFQNLESGFKTLPKIPEAIASEFSEENLLIGDDNLHVIEAPKTPPKAKMGEPEFENLTTAEKMNDSKYRRLIYRAYPSEPTCGCENPCEKKSSKVSNCPGGCGSKCCSSTRKTSGMKKNCRNVLSNSSVRSRRLRGGGEGIGNLENNYYIDRRNNNQYNIENNSRLETEFSRKDHQSRLKGGGEDANYFDQNTDPNMLPNDHKNCGYCADKGIRKSAMQRRSDQPSIKKPCLGIDCLIKAFQEAQEFVDSIGKVPGLAGLGLMDPSESPYFGRNRDDNEPAESRVQNVAPPSPANRRSNRNCTGVCKKKPTGSSLMSGRLGVIREAVPISPNFSGTVIPGPKVKKKDDKTEKKEGESSSSGVEELGPCGEPKCRSKKKKIHVDVEGNSILKGSKIKIQEKNNNKNDSKFDKRKNRFTHGSNGDRFVSKASVKMVRQIAKFVYSAGDTYPGINLGHKTCNEPLPRVPANMGWMWQPQIPLGRLKPRIGWKPGAINSRLRQVLREVKANFWQGARPKSDRPRSKRRTTIKKNKSYSSVRKEPPKKLEVTEEEWKEPPPTLHIHRKDGVYYVTMYPIKDEKMDVPMLEEPTKPLQFKIMKNRDDVSDVSSSTASDMEIEFSPPAAVNRYRKKPDVVHVETQVKQQEIIDAYKPAGSKKTEKKAAKEKKAKK